MNELVHVIDGYTPIIWSMRFQQHKNEITAVNRMNKEIRKNTNNKVTKLIRHPNTPSDISENAAKFAYYLHYKVLPNWNTPTGDLIINEEGTITKLEVKAIKCGPSSFGPTETWNKLIMVFFSFEYNSDDEIIGNILTVKEIGISDNSEKWQQLKVSKGNEELFVDMDESFELPFSDTDTEEQKRKTLEKCKIIELKTFCDKLRIKKATSKKQIIDNLISDNKIKQRKSQTYGDQCKQGRRPRMLFEEIEKQLGEEEIKILYSGSFEELLGRL